MGGITSPFHKVYYATKGFIAHNTQQVFDYVVNEQGVTVGTIDEEIERRGNPDDWERYRAIHAGWEEGLRVMGAMLTAIPNFIVGAATTIINVLGTIAEALGFVFQWGWLLILIVLIAVIAIIALKVFKR